MAGAIRCATGMGTTYYPCRAHRQQQPSLAIYQATGRLLYYFGLRDFTSNHFFFTMQRFLKNEMP